MLIFGDTEGEHMQDFEMLNKAGNMTTDFLKNKAKKEVSKEDGYMGPNFNKTKIKEWFKIKAEREVSEEDGDMDNNFFENRTKAKLKSKKLREFEFEEFEKAVNLEGKIQEEKKKQDKTVFNGNNEKVSKARSSRRSVISRGRRWCLATQRAKRCRILAC